MDLPTYQPGDKITYRKSVTGGVQVDVEATVKQDLGRELLVTIYNMGGLHTTRIFKTSVTVVG